MEKNDVIYKTYLHIIHEELILATGCTEPICIAYAAAKAREVLGVLPENICMEVSGNILKNVKSAVVPGTNGLKGVKAAVAAGIVEGDANAELQVIVNMSPEGHKRIKDYLMKVPINVSHIVSPYALDVIITVSKGEHCVKLRIVNNHTNIVYIEKDGSILKNIDINQNIKKNEADRDLLNIKDIFEFASCVDINDISEVLDKQIHCNTAISNMGLTGNWGAQIGNILLTNNPDNVQTRAKAKAAAGSDARMSGCEMPVVIVSGSGNQGLACSLPVIEYANTLEVSEEKLYRALIISILVTLHQKTSIGKLSAFCGATSAGCGAATGIAYLHGGDCECISNTISNTLAILSGMICDGAKPSCAAKIAAAVDAGILGYSMYRGGERFCGGDGIISDNVDETIIMMGRVARSMSNTDETILNIMSENSCD